MISLINPQKGQKLLSQNLRSLRVKQGLTQKGLADRSGVSVATLRKFEQKGLISLESFVKLAHTLSCLDKIIEATKPIDASYKTMDEILQVKEEKQAKRGWKT